MTKSPSPAKSTIIQFVVSFNSKHRRTGTVRHTNRITVAIRKSQHNLALWLGWIMYHFQTNPKTVLWTFFSVSWCSCFDLKVDHLDLPFVGWTLFARNRFFLNSFNRVCISISDLRRRVPRGFRPRTFEDGEMLESGCGLTELAPARNKWFRILQFADEKWVDCARDQRGNPATLPNEDDEAHEWHLTLAWTPTLIDPSHTVHTYFRICTPSWWGLDCLRLIWLIVIRQGRAIFFI